VEKRYTSVDDKTAAVISSVVAEVIKTRPVPPVAAAAPADDACPVGGEHVQAALAKMPTVKQELADLSIPLADKAAEVKKRSR
jgi:hypothetical protein